MNGVYWEEMFREAERIKHKTPAPNILQGITEGIMDQVDNVKSFGDLVRKRVEKRMENSKIRFGDAGKVAAFGLGVVFATATGIFIAATAMKKKD